MTLRKNSRHDSESKFSELKNFFSQAEEFFCHIKSTTGFVSAFKL